MIALVALTACGTGSGHRASTTTTSSTGSSTSTTVPSTSTTAAPAPSTTRAPQRPTTTTAARGGSVHNVGDADNGKTITVSVGDRVVVTLNSTYWQIDAGSNPEVLRKDGATAYAPSGNCVPGGGCGTATAGYTAIGAGHARITASRTSCGEAMNCTGGAGSYFVDVDVT